MKSWFHEDAAEDIDEAATYYETEELGLGLRFVNRVDELRVLIEESPQIFPVKYKKTREADLGTFPYSLVFLERENDIVILACRHHRRRPGFWYRRMKKIAA
ncbi:MAG: type II toxin-antitoxin system RelE/ParE family toxin [Kiritimatiellae bacterium]|nr:type II toxin-antitoxin system RelE/ParE family toxin [Kiritimatiellia bacterium]